MPLSQFPVGRCTGETSLSPAGTLSGNGPMIDR